MQIVIRDNVQTQGFWDRHPKLYKVWNWAEQQDGYPGSNIPPSEFGEWVSKRLGTGNINNLFVEDAAQIWLDAIAKLDKPH